MSVRRHIELWLSGFEVDPAEIVAPRPDLRIKAYRKGETMRGGRLRPTNWLIIERDFGYLTSWERPWWAWSRVWAVRQS